MDLGRRVKLALDDTRLLILGAQILFGFQLQGVFQNGFTTLDAISRGLNCAAMVLMALTLGLLIAPSMYQLLQKNTENRATLRVATLFAAAAMAPFATSLGVDFYIVIARLYSQPAAILTGFFFCLLAFLCWYGLGAALSRGRKAERMDDEETPTPVSTKIEQMLTEARVILPGAQALLGFELTVMLDQTFARLPDAARLVHLSSLCCVAVSVILLMTPASLHRLAYDGEDSGSFLRIGSAFVAAAPAPLALGIVGDLYVAVVKATGTQALAIGLSAFIGLVLFGLWYCFPLAARRTVSPMESAD